MTEIQRRMQLLAGQALACFRFDPRGDDYGCSTIVLPSNHPWVARLINKVNSGRTRHDYRCDMIRECLTFITRPDAFEDATDVEWLRSSVAFASHYDWPSLLEWASVSRDARDLLDFVVQVRIKEGAGEIHTDIDRLFRMAVEHELNEVMDQVDEFLEAVSRDQLTVEGAQKGEGEPCS